MVVVEKEDSDSWTDVGFDRRGTTRGKSLPTTTTGKPLGHG